MELAPIPNLEVRYIYKNTILSWFDEMLNGKGLNMPVMPLKQEYAYNGKEEIISEYLRKPSILWLYRKLLSWLSGRTAEKHAIQSNFNPGIRNRKAWYFENAVSEEGQSFLN